MFSQHIWYDTPVWISHCWYYMMARWAMWCLWHIRKYSDTCRRLMTVVVWEVRGYWSGTYGITEKYGVLVLLTGWNASDIIWGSITRNVEIPLRMFPRRAGSSILWRAEDRVWVWGFPICLILIVHSFLYPSTAIFLSLSPFQLDDSTSILRARPASWSRYLSPTTYHH